MDRLITWSSLSSFDGSSAGTTNYDRPPPLRTVGTYDDDDFFNNVALNMLSRYEALNLSVSEAICSTLVSPKHRASFYEGLCSRLSRASHMHMSPSQRSLIQNTKKVFGRELRRIVESECTDNFGTYLKQSPEFNNNLPPTTMRHSEKKKKGRRFFPDSDSKAGGFFRSRKVQNIDWKLAEAIQQVQSLRLDGDTAMVQNDRTANVCYQPPQLGH
jgi:hypothetical protein